MTFAEAVVAEMARSGALQRMSLWVNAHLQPWVDWWSVVYPKMCTGFFLMAGAIAERAEQKFPSKGYAPYFEAHGFAPFLARGLGSLIISRGTREADEAKRVAPVDQSIRFLARASGQTRAIVSRAKLVLAASQETSIVDQLFHNAGLHEGEFLRLLQTAIDGGAIDRERIKAIAAAIAPSLPRARGPKITRPSATHELFLETHASLGLSVEYPKCVADGEYTDPQSQATKKEFGRLNFDPRPAYRRVRRRGLVKSR
jgi:hypothetical protein